MVEPIILKTDTRLRVITPVAQREALLDLFERSTSTGKAFAAEHGIKYPTFMVWVKLRRLHGRAESGAGAVALAAESGGAVRQSATQGAGMIAGSPWVEAVATLPHGGGLPSASIAPPCGTELPVALPGGASVVLRSASDASLLAVLLTCLAHAGSPHAGSPHAGSPHAGGALGQSAALSTT